MSNNLRDFIEGEAELDDDEENDGSFDEETGESRPRKSRRDVDMDDSSEEDDDDDDEEAARAVREGFIVDEEDEEEEEGSDDEVRREKRRHKKRPREEREEDELLDEEDLELINETIPGYQQPSEAEPKFKRLKRGHKNDRGRDGERNGLNDIFSDDDEDAADARYNRHGGRVDEFEDFIEDDFPEDEAEAEREQEDREVTVRQKGIARPGVLDATGLDKEALDDMEAIFGDGEDYGWSLQEEEDHEVQAAEEGQIELKDVFEPSQLAEKLLTDEDNEIRFRDEPERFQLDRKPYKNLQILDDQFKEEARYIAQMLWPKKQLSSDLLGPFQKAVQKVLEFFVVDEVEVPYVFHHRKDYLIHAKKVRSNERDDSGAEEYVISADKLLTQDDLWRILELDIKFRGLIERRNALERNFDNLKDVAGIQSEVVESLIPQASEVEEVQDLQDYLHFEYAAQLKDVAAMNGQERQIKRPGGKPSIYERAKASQVYTFVRAYGITPDRLALNVLREGKKVSADDHPKRPMELADSLTDGQFTTSEQVLNAARQTYAEELFMNPRMRKHFRKTFYAAAWVSCRRTEKGLRKIDEQHPYYEIKYLLNQTLFDLARSPELYLKMIKAEEEGLVEVKITLQNEKEFRRQLYNEFASDNFSELADAWNEERQRVLDMAFTKLERVTAKGVKENLATVCQEELLKFCRDEYSKRLDQAPYKPKGMVLGTTPRVLALSNGMGDPGRDPIHWAWVEEDGRVLDHGKFGNLARDDRNRNAFTELVQRRKPDLIAVSGWSSDTQKLVRDIEGLVREKELVGPEFEDPETNDYRSDPLEVVVVNDEVARLYKDSPRGIADHPSFNPVLRYCVALAKYLQNPMKEYAALGKDVTTLAFHPCQHLLPREKLLKTLDTAMVDMVNLCGVDINEAVSDAYTANLLPYVCGLGPRKATSVIKAINLNGGVVTTREELVGDPDSGKVPVVGPKVWNNCASFLYIEYDASNPTSDPLDNTRVHPEDYELGRKMAADALELDEEDVKAETDENGPGAIVRKLFKEDEQEKVNELILEEYAQQLERNYNQRKRATLETIRAELQQPYEELRRNFTVLSPEEIFTLFTGETKDTLTEGMVVAVNVRVVKDDFAIAKLDCGVEGRVESHEISHRHGSSIKDVVHVGQTVQARILELNRRDFSAKLSLREDALRRPYKKPNDHDAGNWDFKLEDADREELTEKDKVTGRAQRVVKHPLFKPFNHTQAEEYLGSMQPGDVVIRPSSRGNDHLAVTWKVADGVYQHIDVLELQKDNEFAIGRTLRIGGKYTYTDLDELIVDHVKAMSRKVDEMMQHDKFRKGSKAETEKWLSTYLDANPGRSAYSFCIDPKHPGYFFLCFKISPRSAVQFWMVKVVPHAFELMNSQYPGMNELCTGFKMRMMAEQTKALNINNRR